MLSFDETRHLTVRTAFGADLSVLLHLRNLNRSEAVRRMLDRNKQSSPPPYVTPSRVVFRKRKNASREEKQLIRKRIIGETNSLKQWWWSEFVTSESPLRERMTLFWHNHFTSSIRKVRSSDLLLRQNQLFRKHALGNFSDLLHMMARDPAMIIYLDGHKNHKANPNENFARELLELFTLGHGHYTENDVKAAALAFTGWGVDRKSGAFRFSARHHENRNVEFLGWRIVSDGEQVIERLLRHPRTAELVAEKVWAEFVSDAAPERTVIRAWASRFRKSGYLMRVLLEDVLVSDEFWDPIHRGSLVKSPVDLLAGAFRELQIPLSDHGMWLSRRSRQLGQDLFNPPNVRGWPGGISWITSQSLLVREKLVTQLIRGQEQTGRQNMKQMGTDASTKTIRWETQVPLSMMESWLLPLPAINLQPAEDHWKLLSQLVADPTYQLR